MEAVVGQRYRRARQVEGIEGGEAGKAQLKRGGESRLAQVEGFDGSPRAVAQLLHGGQVVGALITYHAYAVAVEYLRGQQMV